MGPIVRVSVPLSLMSDVMREVDGVQSSEAGVRSCEDDDESKEVREGASPGTMGRGFCCLPSVSVCLTISFFTPFLHPLLLASSCVSLSVCVCVCTFCSHEASGD